MYNEAEPDIVNLPYISNIIATEPDGYVREGYLFVDNWFVASGYFNWIPPTVAARVDKSVVAIVDKYRINSHKYYWKVDEEDPHRAWGKIRILLRIWMHLYPKKPHPNLHQFLFPGYHSKRHSLLQCPNCKANIIHDAPPTKPIIITDCEKCNHVIKLKQTFQTTIVDSFNLL